MCKSKVGVMWVSVALIKHILNDRVIRKKKRGSRTVMNTLNRELMDSGCVKETVR
jgi:hypothetical protein